MLAAWLRAGRGRDEFWGSTLFQIRWTLESLAEQRQRRGSLRDLIGAIDPSSLRGS